jgi:hypothetical protein
MPEAFIHHNIDDMKKTLAKIPTAVVAKVLKRVAKTAQRDMLRLYRRTTQSWTHRPQFEGEYEQRGTSYTVMVGTDDDIYGYVDLGTRPHAIEPTGPWPLRFKTNYSAKTAPGVLRSWGGGATGPEVRARRVWHPGTEARGFSEEIQQQIGRKAAEQTARLLGKELQRAFRMAGR